MLFVMEYQAKKSLNGDILNIDITVILMGGMVTISRMFWVGKPSIKAIKLIETTFEAMWRGHKGCKTWSK